MKLFSKKIKIFYFFSFVILFITNTLYAAPKKKKTSSKVQPKVDEIAVPLKEEEKKTVDLIDLNEISDQKTQDDTILLPNQKRTFFYKIDPQIISLVEDGSAESIKKAITLLRKAESEYAENEKVLIAIASEIMKTVWPSEKITWNVLPVQDDNPYIGAINSVNNGVLDLSTGNVDFLSTVLPALILMKPSVTVNSFSYEDCEKLFSQAFEKKNDSTLALYLYGALLEMEKQYEKAEEYYKKVYEKTSDVLESVVSYSRVLRHNNKFEMAQNILEKIPEENMSIDLLKERSYVSFMKNDYSAAEQYVARVLQQTPNDLEFVLFRAKILVAKNDYIHALSLLDVYSRQNDSSLEYLLLRAKIQLDWSKNTVAATENVEKAIQLYPDSMEALLLAARIASMNNASVAGQFADDLVEKVLEKNPDNMEAKIYALQDLIQRENWNEAYKISSEIIRKNKSSDIVLKHIEICLRTGKKTEAFEIAKQNYDEHPEDEELQKAYILAYSQVGNKAEVLAYIESLISTANPKLKSYLYYRRSFFQLTEANVLADLRSSLISNPRNSDSLYRLYEIYEEKNDQKKALYYLRQVYAINPNNSSVKQQYEALTKLVN